MSYLSLHTSNPESSNILFLPLYKPQISIKLPEIIFYPSTLGSFKTISNVFYLFVGYPLGSSTLMTAKIN